MKKGVEDGTLVKNKASYKLSQPTKDAMKKKKAPKAKSTAAKATKKTATGAKKKVRIQTYGLYSCDINYYIF